MMIIIDFIIIFAIFVVVSYIAYWLTEIKGLPKWLNYQPFNCRKCLTFWSLTTAYIILWLSLSLPIVGIGGVILAGLNAIAMKINQKNNTVKLEDYDK